jgi:isoleucyl-tRNA synthetase
MTEQRDDTTKADWRSTVFLPKTDFPMKAGLPQKEPGILARWQAQGLYAKLREARAGREKFILHDGPPYANGDMHIGHALNHILKDMVVPHPKPAGQGRALCSGVGLPRPADRMEDRGAVPQEEARQGPGRPGRVPGRMPRLCPELGQRAARAGKAARHPRRLGQSLPDDGFPEAEGTIVAELLKFAESGSSIAAPSR